MRLGEEFTFHPSINKTAKKGSAVFRFQLNHTGEWVTLREDVTPESRDKILPYLSAGNDGVAWRFLDASKPESKPRAPRKAASKPAESAAEAPKRPSRRKAQPKPVESAKEGSE